jgi:signal transduction histidine kinase
MWAPLSRRGVLRATLLVSLVSAAVPAALCFMELSHVRDQVSAVERSTAEAKLANELVDRIGHALFNFNAAALDLSEDERNAVTAQADDHLQALSNSVARADSFTRALLSSDEREALGEAVQSLGHSWEEVRERSRDDMSGAEKSFHFLKIFDEARAAREILIQLEASARLAAEKATFASLAHTNYVAVLLLLALALGAGVSACAVIANYRYSSQITRLADELEQKVLDRTRELHDARDAADEANRAKSLFLASMSHELRTPLNAIIGYSEILLEDAEIDISGTHGTDLQRINAAGRHLLSLIDGVLDLSKIEAGSMEVLKEEVVASTFLSEVTETCHALAAKNGNALRLTIGEGVDVIVADATKLRQIILNLVGNACKFTHAGTVTIMVEREHNLIRISVQDTGIGIAPEDLPKLFANFSQADSTISKKYGGTGLGLALSQKLCGLMGGHIAVESALGSGTCFNVYLPAAPRDIPLAA